MVLKMPLYDYQCRSCQHLFEQLARGPDDVEAGVCPKCSKTGAERKISGFKIGGQGDLRETTEFHGCHSALDTHDHSHKHGPGCGHK